MSATVISLEAFRQRQAWLKLAQAICSPKKKEESEPEPPRAA